MVMSGYLSLQGARKAPLEEQKPRSSYVITQHRAQEPLGVDSRQQHPSAHSDFLVYHLLYKTANFLRADISMLCFFVSPGFSTLSDMFYIFSNLKIILKLMFTYFPSLKLRALHIKLTSLL